MSSTVSMFLGMAFLALAIVAVLLQAWLWGPKYWDDDNERSKAPRLWTNVHRGVGYAYAAIYVFMMWHMVPRLWEYQLELPARTILHAVAAISIGVILVTKIAIVRFFRHFEEAMPRLGFGLLLCTVVLATLSVPYALRAHDLRGTTVDVANVARVERILGGLQFEPPRDAPSLVTREAFVAGREILVSKCTSCHDLRTILVKPRTGSGWQSVVERMLDKPSVVGDPLLAEDVAPVTSYLIAITPDIQKSMKRRRRRERERSARVDAMQGTEGRERRESSSDGGVVAEARAEPPVDMKRGEALVAEQCTQCHELDEVEAYGGGARAAWQEVVARMVQDEGAEIEAADVAVIVGYLAERYPKP